MEQFPLSIEDNKDLFDKKNVYFNSTSTTAETALDIAVSVSTAVSTITAGVGTPTKMLHWRQSAWNTILHNPVGRSVHIFERDTLEPWHNVFSLIKQEILKLNKNWNS